MSPLTSLLATVQGLRLRRTLEHLAPAAGPTSGSAPGCRDTLVRLLVIGDSTAAGVGADDHEHALVGALARDVAQGTGSMVEWRVIARDGATSARVRYTLLPELDSAPRFDLAVVLVGVNDVLAGRPVDQWRDNVSAVLDRVGAQADFVVMTGVPAFDRFASMPRALGRYLAQRGRRLDEVAQQLCRERRRVMWIDSTALLPDGGAFFARDGFHPAPAGYASWAQVIWQRVSAESDRRARWWS